MLNDVIIYCVGEFGRTPRMNGHAGRDHWAPVMSALVMGGGMSNVDELYDDLPPALAARTFSTVFHTPILRNRHGDASGVRGAAWLWKD